MKKKMKYSSKYDLFKAQPVKVTAKAKSRDDDELQKIAVISDVHMGNNTPGNWYQKSFHEPYLIAAFDWILDPSNGIDGLVLLGDFVDFWTYDPFQRPANFETILKANENILGSRGKLNQILQKFSEGAVWYVPGNHDLGITQEDLNKVGTGPNKIFLPQEHGTTVNFVNSNFSHGHEFTMFNNTDYTFCYGQSVPLGHFVTRMIQHKVKKNLKPGTTIADLPDNGNPDKKMIKDLIAAIVKAIKKGGISVAELVLDTIAGWSGISMDDLIILPDGKSLSINQAKKIYTNLWGDWYGYYNKIMPGRGELGAIKAAMADLTGTYMGWASQLNSLSYGKSMSVFGHTHSPINGLKNALTDYANSGFMCPAKPDIENRPPTFAVITTGPAAIYQVVNKVKVVNEVIQNNYIVTAYTAPQDTIVYAPSKDFSCYVIVDNSNGNTDLLFSSQEATRGYYLNLFYDVKRGQTAEIWIQDDPGLCGSSGKIVYTRKDNGQKVTLQFACPRIRKNSCSGASFYTKSGDGDWGQQRNEIATTKHPFFVKFVDVAL